MEVSYNSFNKRPFTNPQPKDLENEKRRLRLSFLAQALAKAELISANGQMKPLHQASNTTVSKPLQFAPIPKNEFGWKRQYIEFADHQITYGQDFSVPHLVDNHSMIGQQHLFKRIEVFYKSCEFIEKNRKAFSNYKICTTPILNQFKATMSYKAKSHEMAEMRLRGIVEAHISLFPNLPVKKENEGFFVSGGEIELDQQKVEIEKMLNLTNHVPELVNHIDALGEAHLRPEGMNLLADVLAEKSTPIKAAHFLATKYRKCLRALAIECGSKESSELSKKSLKKIKQEIQKILASESRSYSGHLSYFQKVTENKKFALIYMEGMLKGIDNWIEQNPRT